jgi:hypothetical protein
MKNLIFFLSISLILISACNTSKQYIVDIDPDGHLRPVQLNIEFKEPYNSYLTFKCENFYISNGNFNDLDTAVLCICMQNYILQFPNKLNKKDSATFSYFYDNWNSNHYNYFIPLKFTKDINMITLH